jgi:hypothetical protein
VSRRSRRLKLARARSAAMQTSLPKLPTCSTAATSND